MKHTISARRRAPIHRGVLIVGVVATAAFALAGCGSDATGSTPAAPGQTAAGETAAAGDNGNGEGTPTRFVSSRYHYRVDAPGTMTEAADGTATATRGIETLTIHVVTGSPVSDPAGYAQNDLRTVQAQSPAYKEVAPLASVSLAGRSVQKVVYSWTNGTNPVTGNPEALVTARYSIPKDASTLAVVVYSIAASQYDPQGADDVASTFQWQ